MYLNITLSIDLALHLLRRILSQPGWIMTLLLLVACLIPFATGPSPFRNDPGELLNPFSLSLMVPAGHAFGPQDLISLAGLLLVPSALTAWLMPSDLSERRIHLPSQGFRTEYPLAATSLCGLYFLISLPVLARSSGIPGTAGIIRTGVDFMLRSVLLSWLTYAVMLNTRSERAKPILGWAVATASHLLLCVIDTWAFAPFSGHDLGTGWGMTTLHAVLAAAAVAAVCLYSRAAWRSTSGK